MLAVYEKMTKEGRIGATMKGPEGPGLVARPFQEYPKLIKTGKADAKGRPVKVLVKDQAEELRAKAFGVIGDSLDPIVAERDDLARQLAEAQTRLATLAVPASPPTPIQMSAQATAEDLKARDAEIEVLKKQLAETTEGRDAALQAAADAMARKEPTLPVPPIPTPGMNDPGKLAPGAAGAATEAKTTGDVSKLGAGPVPPIVPPKKD